LIRPYDPKDAVAVMVITKRSPEAAQWNAEAYANAAAAGQTVIVAEFERQVRGFAVVRIIEGETEILNLAVEPLDREKGIGSLLLASVIEESQQRNVEKIFLEVRESNHAAIAFYQAHGFWKTGQRKKYYRNPSENAVLMEKSLCGQTDKHS
jgi:[ribosomal protein S18]-alanine N-acetyltransferase